MFGYIMGGATIGAVSGGFGEAVLGAFSTTATSGMNLGTSILAYGTSGSLGGAIGGGGFAALAGNDVGKGMLYGAMFGFLGGSITGIGQHLNHLDFFNNLPVLAQNDPPLGAINNPYALDEVVIRGYRNGLNPAHSGAIKPNYFFEELFFGGKLLKGAGSLLKYGSGYVGGLWAGRASKGTFDAVRAFKNSNLPFKGSNLTNAGRAVTKHPEYFGFESTEALMKVYRSPNSINTLGSTTVKDILRNGVRTTGAGGRYPNGWVTYTLPNGRAASWSLDGTFIGFRGIR